MSNRILKHLGECLLVTLVCVLNTLPYDLNIYIKSLNTTIKVNKLFCPMQNLVKFSPPPHNHSEAKQTNNKINKTEEFYL